MALAQLDERERGAAFGVPVFTAAKAGSIASAIVAFPEAIALAAITTDFSIRRHAAPISDAAPSPGTAGRGGAEVHRLNALYGCGLRARM